MLDIDARHGGQVRWPASVSSVENLGVGVRSILQLTMGMVDTARHCCVVARTGIGIRHGAMVVLVDINGQVKYYKVVMHGKQGWAWTLPHGGPALQQKARGKRETEPRG